MANLTLKRLLFLSSCFPTQFLRRLIITTPQTSTTISQKHLLTTVSDSDSDKASSPLSSFTVQYLTNTCGLPLKDALSASKKFQLKENKSHKHQSVLDLLRSFEFSDTHIKKLLIQSPQILQSKVNGNLKPKLEYLRDNGFVGPLLPDLIMWNPVILSRSLNCFIKPTLEFLKKYVHSSDKVVAAVKRTSGMWTFDLKGARQNIEFLLSEGVTRSNIERLVLQFPLTLMHKLDRIAYAVRTVKELGFDPSSPACVQAVRVLLSMSDSTRKRKVQNFKNLGWSEEEIFNAFKLHAICFTSSEEKIKRAMNFYVNTMKLKPEVIAARPKLLSFSLNKRIHPRYNVIKVLESRKLLNGKNKNVWAFALTEKDFLKRYVNKHLDQIPNLLEMYRGTMAVEKMDQLEQSNLTSRV